MGRAGLPFSGPSQSTAIHVKRARTTETGQSHGTARTAAGRPRPGRDTALAERARLLQEEVSARVAEESNQQLYVLSVLSALLLPPTFITGLFGMNVKGLSFAEDPRGILFVLGLEPPVGSGDLRYHPRPRHPTSTRLELRRTAWAMI
ncbi:CorA family divalent cation transporter [Methylobacterium aquaticum]|jgi:hypothetical protein|uniref:CorA family divalent cation transporter n=1 Tax=Methylobacterium aquaticum TaxID=270351 RepID=UPI001FD8CF98|nr:CorA family divalent cation transporter [Methylobacterium aquaticum]